MPSKLMFVSGLLSLATGIVLSIRSSIQKKKFLKEYEKKLWKLNCLIKNQKPEKTLGDRILDEFESAVAASKEIGL